MHGHDAAAAAGERWFDYAAAHPHSSMEIGGVAVITGPAPSTVELHALIDLARAAHPPLRDRARAPGANTRGPAAPADHLEEVALPTRGGDVALHAAIERVCARPLTDVTWGMTLLHGHRDNEFALLLRAHHGLMDGMSLIGVMLAALGNPASRAATHPPGRHASGRPAACAPCCAPRSTSRCPRTRSTSARRVCKPRPAHRYADGPTRRCLA